VPGRAAVAPGSATPELDSTHMNGLIDDKKRSVVPTVQSKVSVCPRSYPRTHGTTFRALKVTSQVATPGAESAVCDCLVSPAF